MKKQWLTISILSVLAIAIGLSGSYFYKSKAKNVVNQESTTGELTATVAETGNIKNGDVFGSADASAFKDSAQGYLEIGGLNEEGSHKLLRTGGSSQTVYLTSSVTDLDKFNGMEVKVWGETQAGNKVGWLMDVGRVEIINIKGVAPEE